MSKIKTTISKLHAIDDLFRGIGAVQFIDGVVDELSVQGLGHEKIDAALMRLFPFDCAVMGGDHDDLDLWIILFYVGDKIEPKTIRKMIIKE